ncbi:hypothetical protein Q3V30_10845 [Erwinia pyri]|uniref:Lipoprotein n=1 Tax=Erwinia pyri TaxID=3062598 RepID=A0AA50DF45_9GAMM|nr:hypothetical protein [Erwinia sp. DE2]WLS76999.1 hypothetical protein Q3V30_10845 [Erwinia sp. DE2]
MLKLVCLIATTLLLSGCALKQYPASPAVSQVQASTLDCSAVETEIADQNRVQAQIDKTGEFDGLTVLGVIGDFGIGNGVAKGLAQKHADKRMSQLKALKQSKCTGLVQSS